MKIKITKLPSNKMALGGVLQSHGGDWSTGLVTIGAGGSHEENPYDGIQVGQDENLVPNLVEEGETIWNDYVFSARINADAETKKKFHLPLKKDITYAEISKKLEKEIAERVNDPISEAGFKAQMQTLQEQQERQKQEMEAERAKAAFEALSPEEQTAIMQRAAQEEQMAQQAAQKQAIAEQQPQANSEELAMAEQAQMQADGSQAMVGQEPQMNAEGGHLFAKGSYLWDKFWSPVNEYSKQRGNSKNKYKIDKTYKGNIKELEDSDAYKAFTDYILNNATDEERLKYFKWIDDNTGKANKYLNKDGNLIEGWQDAYKAARNDGLYGIQHYTPDWQETVQEEIAKTAEPRVFHVMDGDDYDGYIEGELDPKVVGAETRRETLPNGDTVIYHGRVADSKVASKTGTEESGKKVVPNLKNEKLRYAGLFGPAVGLGMQALGIGKPDYSGLNAAVNAANGPIERANYQPIGNYLTYNPMDIWYQQNALNAQARATDRALANSTSPSRAAGLLANSYNTQLASGNLYRQALEYNDAQRKQVEDFNRGTNMFNADAYNKLSMFNAGEQNRARQYGAQMAMHAANTKLDSDAGWYNGIYGNVAGLFKGISDLGKENAQHNMIAKMWADGLAGSATPDTNSASDFLEWAREGKKKMKTAKGGAIKRKKGKRRGLTI